MWPAHSYHRRGLKLSRSALPSPPAPRMCLSILMAFLTLLLSGVLRLTLILSQRLSVPTARCVGYKHGIARDRAPINLAPLAKLPTESSTFLVTRQDLTSTPAFLY